VFVFLKRGKALSPPTKKSVKCEGIGKRVQKERPGEEKDLFKENEREKGRGEASSQRRRQEEKKENILR